LASIPEANREIAHRLLYWIIFAETPLDLLAAAETVKLDVDRPIFYSENRRLRDSKTLLRLCPSLITLKPITVESDPEFLTLSHASIKEFLLSSRINSYTISCFHIPGIGALIYLAESCVSYLLHVPRPYIVFKTWIGIHKSSKHILCWNTAERSGTSTFGKHRTTIPLD
jgi:hypothetical protein